MFLNCPKCVSVRIRISAHNVSVCPMYCFGIMLLSASLFMIENLRWNRFWTRRQAKKIFGVARRQGYLFTVPRVAWIDSKPLDTANFRGGILEVFEDMKTKAEETLSDARTAEMKAQHSSQVFNNKNKGSASCISSDQLCVIDRSVNTDRTYFCV